MSSYAFTEIYDQVSSALKGARTEQSAHNKIIRLKYKTGHNVSSKCADKIVSEYKKYYGGLGAKKTISKR
jgi:hypothetical protein